MLSALKSAWEAAKSLPKVDTRRVTDQSDPEVAFAEALGTDTRLFQD